MAWRRSFSLSTVLEEGFKAGSVTIERILSVVCLIVSIGSAAQVGIAIDNTKKRDKILWIR
jgi:hypothetical protein